jgi:hypothetical protein
LIGRRRTEKGGGEGYTALLKNGENDMNSDLKIGHVSPKTECVRTYVSAFECTCAECVCQELSAFERKGGHSSAFVQQCVCVWWGIAVEHTKVSSYATPRLRSNIHDMYERKVHSKFFFCFLQR